MKKLVFILVMLVMYLGTSELSAKKKAESFCDSVRIGDSTSDLREKGIASGARGKDSNWLELDGSVRQIEITYTGFYPGSDFICRISEKNGVVISKNPNIARSIL